MRFQVPIPGRRAGVCLLLAFLLGAAPRAEAKKDGVAGPDTVVVPSGTLRLRALLWRPSGRGPFPAVLFLHGSGHAPGTAAARGDHRESQVLGPVFAKHGYAFLYLFRRGDALSGGQGTPAGDLMDRALADSGQKARNQVQLELLEGDELNDAIAGLVQLRAVAGVDPWRVAVVGHSFGGSLAMLLAERDTTLRAAVVFSGAGASWDRSPTLRARLAVAADRIRAPVFFVHAANDFTTAPGESLAAERKRTGRPFRIAIYSPVGHTPEEGHSFLYLNVPAWERDVFAFLDPLMRL